MSAIFEPSPQLNCKLCGGHGYTVSNNKEYAIARQCSCVPTCPRCGGSGRIKVIKDGIERIGRCRCQKLPDRIRLFNLAGIPSFHGQSSLHNFDPKPPGAGMAQRVCSSWANSFGKGTNKKGLVLSGRVGRGKTHLMIGLIKVLIFEQGKAVKFIEFSRLLSMLREGYSKGKSDAEVLGNLANAPVLAIDELGKGRLTDWELAIVDDVISRRYNTSGTVLATTNYKWAPASGAPAPNLAVTNYTEQNLGDRVGPRVFSRLQEMCQFYAIGGDDYRNTQEQMAQ